MIFVLKNTGIAILLFLTSILYGSNNLSFTYLNTSNGLSHNGVTKIKQDKNGFIWIGTWGGLNKYDGTKFTVYKPRANNVNSLANISIETILVDDRNNLWIGTMSGGLVRYNILKDEFTNYLTLEKEYNIGAKRILSLYQDKDGLVWIGTWGIGAFTYDYKTDTFSHVITHYGISEFVETPDDFMWMGSTNGFLKYDKYRKQEKNYYINNNRFACTHIIYDSLYNCFWIGSWGHGVIKFDIKTESLTPSYIKSIEPRENNKFRKAYSVFNFSDDYLWVGSWGNGLFVFDKNDFSSKRLEITPKNESKTSYKYEVILDIFKDKSGLHWIGTSKGGICNINKTKTFKNITYNTRSDMIGSYDIRSLYKDQKGYLWIGTVKGGIFWSKDPGYFSFNHIPKLVQYNPKGSIIFTIQEDKTGNKWIGADYGLFKIEKGNIHRYFYRENDYTALRNNKVISLHITKNDTLWIGHQQRGVSKCVGFRKDGYPILKHYYTNTGEKGKLQDQRITMFFEDSKEQLWLGTYKGLHLYNPGKNNFVYFNNIPGDTNTISSDIILCMLECKHGLYWVGTPNGLNRIELKEDTTINVKHYNTENGLQDDYINAIEIDDKNNLWLSTNAGISKFHIPSEKIRNYNRSDGLDVTAFNSNSSFMDEDGVIYFGGHDGLVYFNPDEIKDDSIVPPIVFTGLNIFNKPVKVGQSINGRKILSINMSSTSKITLGHKDKNFTITFAALDFSSPQHIHYKYMLEGFHDQWIYLGNEHAVSFTGLNAGEYVLRVKGSNSNNIWNDKNTSLQIKVLSPPWKTGWALSIYFMVIMLILYLIRVVTIKQTNLENNLKLARLSAEKEKELSEAKIKFFTNITHEFRTPLTLILGPLEEMIIDKYKHVTRSKLQTIYQSAQRLYLLIDQLLEFRKVEKGQLQLRAMEGNIVEFTNEVFLSFKELADIQKIGYTFHAKEEKILLWFDKQKLETILFNIISNAFKYTSQSEKIDVVVNNTPRYHFTTSGNYCEIIIKDTGKGMSDDEVEKIFDRFYQAKSANSIKMSGAGIGLSIVKDLVELHKGQIKVESARDIGTSFYIYLPKEDKHLSGEEKVVVYEINSESNYYHEFNTDNFSEDLIEKNKPEDSAETGKDQEKPVLMIAEDNSEVRRYITQLFITDYMVYEAINGEEALQIALKTIPDIIISDVMMPLMDGIKLSKKLKNNNKTCHIPIVLLTARTSSVFEMDGTKTGADLYITKPFNPNLLIAKVKNLLVTREKLKKVYMSKTTLEPSELEITPFDKEFLQDSIRIIEENIEYPEKIKGILMDHFCMSSSTLYRKLKALTDQSFSEFSRTIRLKRAAQLIKSKKFTINEIIYKVGFTDIKNFRKSFQNQFGCSPSEYKKNTSL